MFRNALPLLVCCASLFCTDFSRAAEVPTPASSAILVQAKAYVYSGSVKTGKYHNASCRYFSCRNCKARFKSAAEAKAQGFVACKVCGG